MAMNIISKEKKEIRWIGLPTTAAQECNSLITEKQSIADRIKAKTQQLNELILKVRSISYWFIIIIFKLNDFAFSLSSVLKYTLFRPISNPLLFSIVLLS